MHTCMHKCVHIILYIHAVHLLCGPLKTPCHVENLKALLYHLFLLRKSLLISKKRQRAKAGVNSLSTICSCIGGVCSYFLSVFIVFLCTYMVSSLCRHRAKPMEDIEVCAHSHTACIHNFTSCLKFYNNMPDCQAKLSCAIHHLHLSLFLFPSSILAAHNFAWYH